MTLSSHLPQVEHWLTSNGWFPGRDIGSRADELIELRLRDAGDHQDTLAPVEAATRVIRCYGELRLPCPDETNILCMSPTLTFPGDVQVFAELADSLGVRLFPVGYETAELGIWLVDESGRFFYQHHTGGYFLGENEYEAFALALSGDTRPDAEDYFV